MKISRNSLLESIGSRSRKEINLAPRQMQSSRRKKSYWQTIKPWSGIYSHDNIIKLVLTSFVTLLNIGALYTIVTSGLLVAWYVAVSFVIAGIFSPPPYLFTAAQVGYLSAGPFIGGLLASIFMAFINDPIIRFCTRRNSGV